MRLTVDDGFGGITTQEREHQRCKRQSCAYGKRRREPANISEGGSVNFHGTGDDPDTEEALLTFQWTQTAGPGSR